MSESVPSVPEAGNTTITKKGDSPASWWCFTTNNWDEKDKEDIKVFAQKCSIFVCQSEVGEKGTPHIQGVFKFDKKIRFSGLKKIFQKSHFEKCISFHNTIEYCRKNETFDGQWRLEKGVAESVRVLPTAGLFSWQAEVVADISKEPDDRHIQWYIDAEGGKGKTALCRYLITHHNAIYINGGKGSDILHVTAEALRAKVNCKLIVFDFPRTLEGKVSYTAIESIKNGLFMSTKYEGGLINMNPPHVVIFANWQPDISQLSLDRWEIYEI